MLTLSMLRCPEGVPPETRQVSGGEFSIGRDPRNAWVLPDPERFLSKKHCVLSFGPNGWQISDTSTNGTFLNHDIEPIRDTPRGLRDGDRILLGSYEMEVALAAGEEPLLSPAYAAEPGLPRRTGASSHLDDRLSGDPFPALGDDPLGLAGNDGVGLSARFDPLVPPSQLHDDAPPMHDRAFLDARYTPPRGIPRLLPDDWDAEVRPDASPGAPPDAPPDAPPGATPGSAPGMAPGMATPGQPPAGMPPHPPFAVAGDAGPAASEPLPPDDPTISDVPAPDAGAGLAALLRGAGMASAAASKADAQQTLHALGAAFRAMVHGLRQIMIGRASIKGEFRIEQTAIRASGNNPLKFSADDEDALRALLGLGRPSELSPEAAVSNALRDMRLHEVAMMTAMQEAVRDLLRRLDPERLGVETGPHLLDGWPGWRKSRNWDLFAARHRTVVDALSDDFDSVFGKAFARAYERAMTEAEDATDDDGHPGR